MNNGNPPSCSLDDKESQKDSSNDQKPSKSNKACSKSEHLNKALDPNQAPSGPEDQKDKSTNPSEKRSQSASRETNKKDETESVQSIKPVEPFDLGEGYSKLVKVFRLGGKDGETSIPAKPLTTIALKDLEATASLSDLRKRLGPNISEAQKFCHIDGSPVEDSLSLTAYFSYLDEHLDPELIPGCTAKNDMQPSKEEGELEKNGESQNTKPLQKPLARIVYVQFAPDKAIVKPKSDSVLSKEKFIINILQWEIAADTKGESKIGTLKSRGTLHSKAFDNASATEKASVILLGGLRRKLASVSSMSTSPRVHKFCTSGGVTVADETITFADYLKFEGQEAPENVDLPSVAVFYKLDDDLNSPDVDMAKLPGAYDAGHATTTNLDSIPSKKAAVSNDFGIDRAFKINSDMGDLNNYKPESVDTLTPDKWQVVLDNCGLLHGWIIDRANDKIVRAPRPAFQLRETQSDNPIDYIPDFLVTENEDRTSIVPASSNATVTAAHNTGSNNTATAITTKNISENQAAATSDLAPIITPELKKNPMIRKPRYIVNDDSRVEITVVDHEFERSMAENDFSSHSTEAALSGGYAGLSASLSFGYAAKNQNTKSRTKGEYHKTMIGKYLFPRCDILLNSEDLEPSPELLAALKRIGKTKNVNDLRQLYQDFGHLFCQRVTVGGRLKSTKILTGNTDQAEQEQKESFKASVGAQVSSVVGVGLGSKHEREQGKSKSHAKGEKISSETNVFEAVGGDTLLASVPNLWILTVASSKNWRVIDRDRLMPMADLIAALPGYGALKTAFAQAVPTLSKYVEFGPAREVTARLRLTSPTTQLSHSYLVQQAYPKLKLTPAYYLGHSPDFISEPRHLTLKSTQNIWLGLEEDPEDRCLFSPSSFRAPAILGYASERVDYGARYDKDFTNTLWSIISPFNEALTSGGLVVIKTKPMEHQGPKVEVRLPEVNEQPKIEKNPQRDKDLLFTDEEPKAGTPIQPVTFPLTVEPEKDTAPPLLSTPTPASLVVFRNAQGVFLPGMSGPDEMQYWRIYKNGAKNGEYIQEGDQVRLAWAFADQTNGFRDFLEDVYGRRRSQIPPELETHVLYFKLPWPRFESLKAPAAGVNPIPNSLIMSAFAGSEFVAEQVATIPAIAAGKPGKSCYGIQDVMFRIDTLPNGARGDTDDYLLKGLIQNGCNGQTHRPINNTTDAKKMLAYQRFFLDLVR